MDIYRRSNARKKQLDINAGTILFFVPYWLMSVILLGLFFALASVFYIITPLSNNALPLISRVIVICCELIIAFLASRAFENSGFISGLIFGLGFSLILLLVGLFTTSISLFSLEFPLFFITGTLVGIFGGVLGKGSAPKKKRQRGYIIK